MSAAAKKQSPESREKIAAALRGRHIHSAESRAKISASSKLQWQNQEFRTAMQNREISPEVRAKLSASGRGRKRPPEVISKIAAALKGRVFSAETLAKMRASQRARRATAASIAII